MIPVVILAMLALGLGGFLRSLRSNYLAVAGLSVAGIAIARPLLRADASLTLHPGIAPAAPVLYSSAVVAIVVLVAVRGERSRPMLWVAPVAWVVTIFLFLYAWTDNSAAQWAGLLSLAAAATCFVAGTRLCESLSFPSGAEAISAAVLALLSMELAVGLLQYFGAFALEASDQGLFRVRGTFGHAGDLGKVVVAATAISLACLSFARTKRAQRLTVSTVLSAFVVTGLTASRSNLLALVILILAWALLARERAEQRLGRRLLFLGGLAVLPFAGTYILRFLADPDGGSRPQLLQAAFEQIRHSPVSGTGLNSYVQVVGASDAYTASGLPVHNVFVLLAAELGVPLFGLLAALLLVPVVRMAGRRSRELAPAGAALLAYSVAMFFLCISGWGVLKVTVLPFIAFAFGVLVGAPEPRVADGEGEEVEIDGENYREPVG